MCRRKSVDLPSTPASASKARDFLGEICARWELPELRDDLKLAVSELVTNSILHARTPISMNVSVGSGHVEVGVRDHDPRPPTVRAARTDLISDLDTLSLRLPAPADDADPRHPSMQVGEAGSVAAGRGLHLLEAVTDEWGVIPFNGANPGKEVWFLLGIPPGWPHGPSCMCHRGSDFKTASGRPVAHIAGPWDEDVPA